MSNVLLGITGGIAAYKSAIIARLLVKSGHKVRVMMTPDAEKFVGAVTLEALTGGEIMTETHAPSVISHIDFAKWADICLIAPATANIIGKLSSGIADDRVSSTLLAVTSPLVVAPAMNSNMYAHPAVQKNIALLKSWGVYIAEPAEGELACSDSGKGRMREPEEIVALVCSILENGCHQIHTVENDGKEEYVDTKAAVQQTARDVDHEKVLSMIEAFEKQSVDEYLDEPYIEEDHMEGAASELPLDNIRILITAGPTRECIDPVRYITNRSSGRMGYALAEEAHNMGAKVTLITGETSLKANVPNVIKAVTSSEMYDAVMANMEYADVIIMAAAVADYAPAVTSTEKIKKSSETMILELVKTKDILKEAGARKKEHQILIGFAAETENIEDNALKKLEAKNLDIIAANDVSDSSIGFDSEYNDVTLFFKGGSHSATGKCTKRHIAKIILTEGAILYNQALHIKDNS